MKSTTTTAGPIPVCILVRVSTKKQETARQIRELQDVASAKGWHVVEICEEQISGTADSDHRTGLNRAMELVKSGTVKKVLVHEVSRVARRNSIAHEFVEFLESHGASLYWHAQGVETLLPNGKRNPAAAIMFALLSEMARAERETLVERINSGLAEARRKGVQLGRPKGAGALGNEDLLAKHKDIVKRLKGGMTVRDTAKATGKGTSTVTRVARAMKG